MRIAVIGSRSFTDYHRLKKTLDNLSWEISEIISGGAEGADTLAEQYATENNIPTVIIKPDFKKYPPKRAPLIRNHDIVERSEKVVAFWNGKSGGTAYTIRVAEKLGIETLVIQF